MNDQGQIGDGTTTDRSVPTAVQGGRVFASLADGSANHACGLTSVGAAYCWGANAFGTLGDGTIVNRLLPVAVSGGLTFKSLAVSQTATCGITITNALYCWGWAGGGIYGDGAQGIVRTTPTQVNTGGLTFASVTVGQTGVCALTFGGSAYCWGLNGSGQLGDNTTSRRTTPTAVAGGLTFASISAGDASTCAVTPTNIAYCWGANGNGRLGDNTTTNRRVPTPVAGSLLFS